MKSNFFNNLTRTLRARVSLWYLASFGFTFLIFSVAVTVLSWITVQGQIDHHVHIAVYEAQQIVRDYQGEERDSLIKNLVSAQGMTVVVPPAAGHPILEPNVPGGAVVPEHQLKRILTSVSLSETEPIHFTEDNMRFAALPVGISAGKGIVAVGYSTQVLRATFYKMLGVVAGVIVLLVIPITLIGHRLLKRHLEPLENIAEQAQSVSDLSSLSRRISVSSPTEELAAIQEALNTMLARLEAIFRTEREFFSDAAHTLKTPLAVLRSQIENSDLPDGSRRGLLDSIDDANETVQDLLLLSRIDDATESETEFSLSRVMEDLVELVDALGQDKDLTVSADIQDDVEITGDRQLVRRALSNIVHNAVAYNKQAGSIEMTLSESEDIIRITIADTGIGIEEQEIDKAFDRFFRGSNAPGRGSGLGLAIARAVIEQTGGRIVVDSRLGDGTTVIVEW